MTGVLRRIQPHFPLPALPHSSVYCKQSKKRKTELEKATNKKKLNSANVKPESTLGVVLGEWLGGILE